MYTMKVRDQEVAFDWDEGNLDKSYKKHGVTPVTIEEIFADENLGIVPDVKHSDQEKRLIALGKTESGKNLFVVFTMRGTKIRVISARRMHQREVDKYEKAKKHTNI